MASSPLSSLTLESAVSKHVWYVCLWAEFEELTVGLARTSGIVGGSLVVVVQGVELVLTPADYTHRTTSFCPCRPQ